MKVNYSLRVPARFVSRCGAVAHCLPSFLTGLFLVLLPGAALFGQVNIIDPNAANTPDLSTCYSTVTLEVLLPFGTDGIAPTPREAGVSLPLPTGMDHVAGTVMLVAQTGAR